MKSERRKNKKHKRKINRDEEAFIIKQIMNHNAHLICVRHDWEFFWLVRMRNRKQAVAVTDKERLKVSVLLPPDLSCDEYLKMKL